MKPFCLPLFALLAGVASWPLAAEPFSPIKASKDVPIMADFVRQHHAWAKRVLLQPLAKSLEGKPGGPAAVAFAEKYVDDLAVTHLDSKAAEVSAEGAKLIEAGCTDPLVRYLTARIGYRATSDWGKTAGVFRQLIEQLEREKTYGRALLCFIGKDLETVTTYGLHPEKGLEARVAAWTGEALQDGSYQAEDDLVLSDHLLGQQWVSAWERDRAGLEKAVSASPAPEWIRKTLHGYLETELAWKARGGDWAARTNEKQWEGFGEHLQSASENLVAAWVQRPQRPYAAAEMITVTMGGAGVEGQSERLWFDRALAAQLDYTPACEALLWAYRPRWGGSLEAMLAVGGACRATGRYDTELPHYFWTAFVNVLEEVDDKPAFLRSQPALLKELAGHWRDCLASPFWKKNEQFSMAMLVCTTWLQGDYAAARKAAAGLKNGLAPAYYQLQAFRVSGYEVLADLSLHGTKAGLAAERAEAAYRTGDLDAAEAGFKSALAAASEEVGRQWLTGRLAVTGVERSLGKGDWVRIVPHPGTGEWVPLAGRWRIDDEKIIAVGEGYNGLLVYRGRIGRDLELRGEFEIDSIKNQHRILGLVASFSPEHSEEWYACSTWQIVGATTGSLFFGQQGSRDAPNEFIQLKGWNKFYIRCQGGAISWTLNGQEVLKDYRPKEGPVGFPNGQIGISNARLGGGNTARVRNLEVRRLSP